MTTSEMAAEAATVVEEAVTVTKNNPILLAGVALVSLSAGGFIGYKYAVRKLTTKYDEALDREIKETREFLVDRSEPEELDTNEFETILTQTDKDLVRAIRNYHGYTTDALPGVNMHVHEMAVEMDFPSLRPKFEEWGDDEEVDQTGRNDRDPYLISFNEYHTTDRETIQQAALTYYMVDDTLADEADNPIENVPDTIGVDNLDVIRHGDKMTYYVRNPRTEMEFEVDRYNKSFAVTVLGLGDDG